jgi:hypothetical protein
MDNIKLWLTKEALNLIFVWSLSLLLMWSTTRSIRLAIPLFLVTSIMAFNYRWFKEVLLVSLMTVLPLGLVFCGVDVFIAAAIFLVAAIIFTFFVKMYSLPKYFSSTLYVPVLAITLVLGQML